MEVALKAEKTILNSLKSLKILYVKFTKSAEFHKIRCINLINSTGLCFRKKKCKNNKRLYSILCVKYS